MVVGSGLYVFRMTSKRDEGYIRTPESVEEHQRHGISVARKRRKSVVYS